LFFSGKILIIMEKFRVFLDNLGIRAKMWNFLFKKWRRGEENFNHKKKISPLPHEKMFRRR
jgi:hypothetical protein